MARKQLGFLSIGLVCLGLALLPAQAGESGLQKELDELNQITGDDVSLAVRKKLIEDPEHTAALLKFGLSAANKNQLSYNAALALGYAAAKAKDMKTAEVYLRVCLGKAAKLQSLDMLRESGETLAEFYYEYKQYADCARICKELSELKTDGATDRVVIQTIKDRNGRIDFGEPQEGFKLSERLKGDVYDIRIKALAKQGKFDQALKFLDKEDVLIEPFTLGLKGWVLHEAGKFDESADAYEKAIAELGKDDKFEVGELQFRYEVANVYVDLKKVEQATDHLEYVIKKRPDSPVFYNDLGFIWADNGIRLEEAEKLIRKAIPARPRAPQEVQGLRRQDRSRFRGVSRQSRLGSLQAEEDRASEEMAAPGGGGQECPAHRDLRSPGRCLYVAGGTRRPRDPPLGGRPEIRSTKAAATPDEDIGGEEAGESEGKINPKSECRNPKQTSKSKYLNCGLLGF